MALPTFASGQRLRASALQALIDSFRPLSKVKTADQGPLTSTTTLVNDTHLFVSLLANTNYWLDVFLLATEASGATADIKYAWTMPALCRLDAGVVGAHVAWSSGAGTALEAEWAGWQNEFTPTTAKGFGLVNGVNFSHHVRGVLRNGANAGTLQLQWAPNANVADGVTLKAGSALMLTPLP